MEINEIYQEADKIVLKHLMFYDDALAYSQSWGYNGYKRMFRVLCREAMEWHMQLKTDLFDYYRIILKTPVNGGSTSFSNLKALLEMYKTALNDDIAALGRLNKEHFEKVGTECKTINEIICCFKHKWNKVSRWLVRFNETNWNIIELHIVDDALHEKMKQKEAEHAY